MVIPAEQSDGSRSPRSVATRSEACRGITTVTHPRERHRIGDPRFSGGSGLASVTIPGSVASIGECAFSGCTGLASVSIPGSVTTICDYAFSGCTGLSSVTIPGSVTSIGQSAFAGCSGLSSITIPEGVTTFSEESAFGGCSGLTSVTIPAGRHHHRRPRIRLAASGLTTITIPSSVTAIAPSAFWLQRDGRDRSGARKPQRQQLRRSALRRGRTALSDSLRERWWLHHPLQCHRDRPRCVSRLHRAEQRRHPRGRHQIGHSAFSGCAGLTSVIVPGSVTAIGYYTFSG